jgi:hypothetical protein
MFDLQLRYTRREHVQIRGPAQTTISSGTTAGSEASHFKSVTSVSVLALNRKLESRLLAEWPIEVEVLHLAYG